MMTPTPRPDAPVQDRELPVAVAERIGGALGVEPPATFGGWLDALAERFEDGAALCTTDTSRHEARIGEERHHLRCVLDGLVLAHLQEEPVTVRSESRRSGETVTLTADGGTVETEPEGAVVSFGVGETAGAADAYGSFCPYVDAFPSLVVYERWAEETDAATTPLSVAAAHELAGAIAARMKIEGAD